MRQTMEEFTMIEKAGSSKPFHLFDNVVELESAKTADHDLQYVAALREQYPKKIVTVVPQVSTNIIAWAENNAEIKLDTKNESFASWRGYVLPQQRALPGRLGEARQFAKYDIKWAKKEIILYAVQIGFSNVQYVLTDRQEKEDQYGPSDLADALIMTVGEWQRNENKVVWVFNNYWQQDASLYYQIEKASWDKVILDESMKKELSTVAGTFFDSKKVYEDLGVPWKRGLLFHGPPGNGKTISIKALMHELLFDRKDDPIPTLYVKSAPMPYMIPTIFSQARRLAPCILILEDVESIVNSNTRSLFFNEMDGLASNDGLLVIGSTNYLNRLDPGLTKRPSRFDRKYLFPLPNEHERTLYCQFWQKKVSKNPTVDFPDSLCQPMASITPGFSFAFLQECFVATMLTLARADDDAEQITGRFSRLSHDDLDDYEVWREFKYQANELKKQIDGDDQPYDSSTASYYQDSASTVVSESSQQRMPGAPLQQQDAEIQLRAQIPFYDRKQPEVSSAVWSWVGPRGSNLY
ncbi:hypothetical protein MRB53_037690 [Persea americana]|nr:hypothetical protein MRB53_037690 [Persea americana]